MISATRLQYFLFLAILIVLAVVSATSYTWIDCCFLFVLCCSFFTFWLKPSIFTFRIPLVTAFLFLSSRLPPSVNRMEVISGIHSIAELVHLIVVLAAVIILVVTFVRRRSGTFFTFELIDIVALIVFLIFLWYGTATIVLAMILQLPLTINPQIFNVLSTAIMVFLWTKSLMISRPENCKKLVTGTAIILWSLFFYEVHLIYRIDRIVHQAVTYEARGDHDQAISLYKKGLQLNQTIGITSYSTTSLTRLGVIYYRNGSFAEAETHFKRSRAIAPDDPLVLCGHGASFYYLNRLSESLTEFRKLVRGEFSLEELEQIFSPDPEISTRFAIVLNEQKQYDLALALFQKARDAGFESGESQFHMGCLYYNRGNIDASLKHLVRAEQLGFRDPALYYQLSLVFSEQDKWQEALMYGLEAISQSPLYLNAYSLLEKICTETGNTILREKLLQSKKTLNPQQTLTDLETENVALLGYSFQKNDDSPGGEISVSFYTQIRRKLEHDVEPLYLCLESNGNIYFKTEFNLLDGMIQATRKFYVGDVIKSQFTLSDQNIYPGLCELTFFLPGDRRLDPRMRNKLITEVNNDRYRPLAVFTLYPKIYHRRTFTPDQIGHIFDKNQEQLFLEKYVRLSSTYTIDIPLTDKQKSFLCDSLILISTLSFGEDIEQNTVIAQLLIADKNDRTYIWDIKAGVDTAEWAIDSPEVRMRHRRAKPAYSREVLSGGRKFDAHIYYSVFSFPRAIQLESLQMKNLANRGCIEVCDIIIQGKENIEVIQRLPFINKTLEKENKKND